MQANLSPAGMHGRSVFVTGGYGLLGSWLVKSLVERGARTTVLKRDAVARSALVVEGTEHHVNVVHGDVCDAALIERALGEYDVDTVFHLAAQPIVGIANTAPAVHVRDEYPGHVDGVGGLPPPRGTPCGGRRLRQGVRGPRLASPIERTSRSSLSTRMRCPRRRPT